MVRLRLVVTTVALALLMGGLLIADDKKPGDDKKDPPAKLKGMLPPNWKKLGLSEEQVQKIYKVQAEYDQEINKLWSQIYKLRDEKMAKMKEVLTDAQKARLKEIRSGEPATKDAKKEDKKP